jgi:F-type H+-transporting ATPase subunit gamma
MANLLDIKRRIRSVKNTQQITRAMKMVAAARLRRSQDRILATRPYALEIRSVIANLAAQPEGPRHPLLEQRQGERVLLVLVSGDKGLAGSFNANVLRRSLERLAQWPQVELLLLGKKGADFYRRKGRPIFGSHSALFSSVEYADAERIARELIEAYTGGRYDRVHVIYNQFKSMMLQELTEEQLLPVVPAVEPARASGREYLFEPSAQEILEELLPRYLSFQVYRILLESQAAEHAARMTAMDAATKNASEMIDGLTLQYNRARQAAITKEIIEVVSGANALG